MIIPEPTTWVTATHRASVTSGESIESSQSAGSTTEDMAQQNIALYLNSLLSPMILSDYAGGNQSISLLFPVLYEIVTNGDVQNVLNFFFTLCFNA